MFRFVALLLLLTAVLTPAHAGCFPDWSQAAPIVRKEGLATVEAVARAAHARFPGVIVRTTLCEDKGEFVYRLVVRAPDGRLANETVNARAPFAP